MINLILLSSIAFELSSGSSSTVLPRAYAAKMTREGKIIIKHVSTGAIVELGVLSDILVEGLPATFEDIRKTVFNFSCVCLDDGENPDFKIFDYTFDSTFE